MNNQDTDKYTVILDRCSELCVSFRTGSAGHEGRIRRATTGSAVGAGTFFRSQDGTHGIVLPGAIWIVRARA